MTIENKLIADESIDNLLKDYQKPGDLIGESGLLKQLTKRLRRRKRTSHLLLQPEI